MSLQYGERRPTVAAEINQSIKIYFTSNNKKLQCNKY